MSVFSTSRDRECSVCWERIEPSKNQRVVLREEIRRNFSTALPTGAAASRRGLPPDEVFYGHAIEGQDPWEARLERRILGSRWSGHRVIPGSLACFQGARGVLLALYFRKPFGLWSFFGLGRPERPYRPAALRRAALSREGQAEWVGFKQWRFIRGCHKAVDFGALSVVFAAKTAREIRPARRQIKNSSVPEYGTNSVLADRMLKGSRLCPASLRENRAT